MHSRSSALTGFLVSLLIVIVASLGARVWQDRRAPEQRWTVAINEL